MSIRNRLDDPAGLKRRKEYLTWRCAEPVKYLTQCRFFRNFIRRGKGALDPFNQNNLPRKSNVLLVENLDVPDIIRSLMVPVHRKHDKCPALAATDFNVRSSWIFGRVLISKGLREPRANYDRRDDEPPRF
jgi:hypothetical protein